MNPFRELFEKYKKGILEDALVGKLHHLVIEIYFNSPNELKRDEIDFAEDLIIELYSKDQLDNNYVHKFQKLLKDNKILSKKLSLLSSLNESLGSNKSKRLHGIIEPELENKEDEKELSEVLDEVIEQVHVERESSTFTNKIEQLINEIQIFFKELIPPIDFNLPQVKLAMVVVSMAVIVIVVWMSVNPGLKEQLADNTVVDTVENTQIVKNDTIRLQIENRSLELIKREKLSNLVAANFEPSQRFNYTSSRSVTPTSIDTLIIAAKAYNTKNYKECITTLTNLLDRNSFNSSDTISLIYFYLGNSYLVEALNQNNKELVKLSISSFNKIDQNTPYYIPSNWYAVFAHLQLDDEDKGLELLDTLIQINQYRVEEAKILKDEIVKLK